MSNYHLVSWLFLLFLFIFENGHCRQCMFAHECPFQSFCIEGLCEKVTLPATTQSIVGFKVTQIVMIIVMILIIFALIFLIIRWIFGIRETKEKIRSRQASQVSVPSTLYRVY